MRYLLIIFSFLLLSCELFEQEKEEEVGICVFYEVTFLGDLPLHNYDCWNNFQESACYNGTWSSNQTCEEFCAEKAAEEYTICSIKN
tara:strand:- start:68 stop:328 length:261 start_codon:yes stop_codon:yes gene_type:complete